MKMNILLGILKILVYKSTTNLLTHDETFCIPCKIMLLISRCIELKWMNIGMIYIEIIDTNKYKLPIKAKMILMTSTMHLLIQ